MKIFVTVLMGALALAQADISLTQAGYNYRIQQQQQQQQQHQSQVQLQPPVVAHLLNQQLQQQQQQHQQQSSHPVLPPLPLSYLPPGVQYQSQAAARPTSASFPMPAGFPINFQTAPAQQHRRPRPRVRIPKRPIVTKNFFIHSAPEESDDEVQDELNQLAQQPRNHYNVLFVKTPAQTNRAAALNLAKTLKQEKTVVYVLAKKTTAADLQDAIAESPQHINKPEVFFIKYRTPEEAVNAQRQIQSQYDTLGGSSTITDEGVAPITSVVGSLDPQEEDEEEQQQQQQQQGEGNFIDNGNNGGGNAIGNHYLPANQF
ncbi:probable basic-leucine zipper transcription factor Q [Drosophila guanche]|uniref:DUF243 domain-containing protein n=1 Tax=Drosophila guanche TaxID=7266 RepID=A0A3B0KA32_DROGU|nr:probable basic-leucine zipper transcription factor Q [Drosophila guanche]SPP80408.1 Hypothetical predicted protein [Drosophila guanche]